MFRDRVAVVHLFLLSMKVQSSVVLDCVAKPCLQILHQIVTPATASSKKNKVSRFWDFPLQRHSNVTATASSKKNKVSRFSDVPLQRHSNITATASSKKNKVSRFWDVPLHGHAQLLHLTGGFFVQRSPANRDGDVTENARFLSPWSCNPLSHRTNHLVDGLSSDTCQL